ncbi:TPA: hypothetical protein EYP13_03535 [Candidatus Micrarchaeota archaeon]|nr:hypothetical protein [Candidatus Micrarchaeota archaeon]
MVLVRLYTYFKRGWQFIAVPVAAVNFVLITYRLLVEKVSFLHRIFPSLTVYALVVVPLGVLLAVLLGYWDYKHGTAPVESERIARYSPWTRSLARALYHLADGDPDAAKQELERWM